MLSAVLLLWLLKQRDPYGLWIAWNGRIYGIPGGLIRAIIAVESGGRPVLQWVPSVRDWVAGPMQVRLQTARWLGFRGDERTLNDPVWSILYGIRYLRWQLERYGNVEQALSAYNAGSYTPDNLDYVRRVLTAWRNS